MDSPGLNVSTRRKSKQSACSADAKERFIELRARGFAYESIATELGISRQTLQAWSKDLRADIENCKAIRLDVLRTRYRLLQQHQIETFGELLERIKSELAKRDLAEVPTHRLMDMFLKCSMSPNEFSQPPEFVEKVEPVEFAMLNLAYQSRSMP